ncbi:hypothetical protein ACFQZS_14150 [Mucilaginibacter calamicampi]|uniref:Uncharacterized protein n=1 Tax=Mucilaginibacter calamicampi TaxID=1302352 RepID=A0ABW2YZK2_9SPHI
MSNEGLNRLYEKVLPDLIHWAKTNDRLHGHITEHDLSYLFEFNGIRGLTIDLGRFHPDYYNTVFKGLANKRHIDAFVGKVCIVIKLSLARLGRQEHNITIQVRHKVSTVTYWKTYYITPSFDYKGTSGMQLKEE